MIAVVSSTLDPAPDHTVISSVSAYLDYVRGTNNIAYRNMDVVDLAPGTPGHIEMTVRSLGADIDGYALRLDDTRFVLGAKVLIRGPAKVLLDAAPRGLKLAGRDRENDEVIYELLDARDRRRHFEFNGIDVLRSRPQPGFEQLRIPDEFTLRIDFELPDRQEFAQSDPMNLGRGHTLTVRQYWKDEPVGGNSIRLHRRR
jgi:hypothetical protein